MNEIQNIQELFDNFIGSADELIKKYKEKDTAYQQGRFDERRDMKAKLIDLIEEL